MNDVLLEIFDINNETRARIRKNVTTYYLNYLSPKGIVVRIMNENFQSIRVQAELISLSLIHFELILIIWQKYKSIKLGLAT